MNDKNSGLVAGLLRKASQIEENEIKATVSSFLFGFILMAAYYVLRPVRDAMASDWTDAEVSTLWTINFFISTPCVALYGIAVSRLNFRKLVPSVYLFFAASFAVFYLSAQSSQDAVLVDKTFYVWVSVFALFNTSVFWSFMADTFNKEQAGRLFAVILAGTSLGAIVGSLLSGLLVNLIGIRQLMLVSALMLLLPIPLTHQLGRLKVSELHNQDVSADLSSAKIGGNPFVGFKEFFTNPYLLGIGIFLILYTGIGSFVYLEQKNLLEVFTIEERTTIYAYRDALVNTITYALAFFFTGRIITKFGMPTGLMIVPLLIIFGMAVLAFSPVWIVAVGLGVVRSAGNYGLTRPAREMLFTHVSRESRFKTKPVVDIVAYRGGDVIMAWFFTGLTQGLGLGLAAVAAVGAGIAALWAFVGYRLGKAFDGKSSEDG